MTEVNGGAQTTVDNTEGCGCGCLAIVLALVLVSWVGASRLAKLESATQFQLDSMQAELQQVQTDLQQVQAEVKLLKTQQPEEENEHHRARVAAVRGGHF